MKKITINVFVIMFMLGTFLGVSQTLNQPANWPNANWTLSGTYNPVGLLSDPTGAGTSFTFDDDAAGNGNVDMIMATSPVIDLSAAAGAGETWITISGAFTYYALGSDILAIEVYDADTMTWSQLYQFAGNTTTVADYQNCTISEAYTTPVLNIAGFTPTQLSGFQYRVSYDDVGGWQYGYCVESPTITSATPPSCPEPLGLSATPTSTTDADIVWSAGGTETDWTYEYGVSPYTQGGGGTTGTVMTTPTLTLMGLTPGETYDIYVQANCGAGGDSNYVTVQWTQPNVGDSCAAPIAMNVETDCSTATPYTIDYSTAADLGTSDLSCDTFGVNTGAWFEFTTTATGAITLNMSDSNEYAIFDACGGTEIVCVFTATTSAEIILSPSTTYKLAVWKDSATTGTTDVCIEEFTPPTPPDCAETPITPADGAVDVVVTAGAVTLTWTAPSAGPAPTDYRIFFGETSGALADLGTLPATETTVDITGIAFSTTYFWQVVPENGGSPATGCAEWSFTTEAAPPPPSNDDCANAIVVTPGGIFADNPITGQTNVSATDSGELPLPGCASYDPTDPTGNGGDLWYAVTVPSDGNLTIETDSDPTGNGGDGGMAVYTGSCGALALFECDDDDGNGLYGQVIIEPADGLADQTVYIRVWEFGGDGIINFQVSAFSATLSTGSLENEAAFTYYPNPVENILTLNAASNNIDNVVMFNMLGQQVMQVTPNDLTSELDMSSLQTGTYFVRVTVANVTKTIRVVKQ